MISLQHVQKYYNRRKANEIHVINDTTLEIGDAGMVAILGPSGSGKTTLLNAIGGLDSVSRGKIFINGKKITRWSTSAIDNIRNVQIGYIFQNYNLLDERTVFDNVALALKLTGVRKKDEITRRVHAVLEAVDMFRFRNRPADTLSGGQRQRVAIARALVKDPAILIADEPTGNLDSENTLSIMNILKGISQTRLVLLVTHEEDLARFYADRILEIRDGKITADIQNEHGGQLDYRTGSTIYLKDLPVQEMHEGKAATTVLFSDGSVPLRIILAVQNGSVYIKANHKIEVLDEQSRMRMANEHYQKISLEDVEKKGSYSVEPYHNKKKYSSPLWPFQNVVNGFRAIGKLSRGRKFLLVGFILASLFVTLAISNIQGVLVVKDEDFLQFDRSAVTVTIPGNPSYDTCRDLMENAEQYHITAMVPNTRYMNLLVRQPDYFQTSSQYTEATFIRGTYLWVSPSLAPVDMITESDLVAGRLPESDSEIVVDSLFLENNDYLRQAGCLSDEDMIGLEIYTEWTGAVSYGSYYPGYNGPERCFTVVGVSGRGDPTFYFTRAALDELTALLAEVDYSDASAAVSAYPLYQGLTLTKGNWPVNDYEVILPDSYRDVDGYQIGEKIPDKVNGVNLTVTGYYDSRYSEQKLFVSLHTAQIAAYSSFSDYIVYSDDPGQTAALLKDKGLTAVYMYEYNRQEYISERRDIVRSTLTTAGIILAISLIEMFLMMRSTFLSRIREVGVLRAIGVKKWDIYRQFSGEVIAVTLLTSAIGMLMAYPILYNLVTLSYMSMYYTLNSQIFLESFLLVLAMNLLIGLLPVWNTLRKTPAAILSRIDVD